MDRIKKLCSFLSPCETFADVGCDHGYCTLYMLKSGKCKSARVSDISAKSLSKAERLLKDYITSGKCSAVCAPGLEGLSQKTDEVLIAGMGGEEIISILKNSFIPKTFVFQPMHGAPELRKFLLERGAQIIRDDVFLSGGKYYAVLCGERGERKEPERGECERSNGNAEERERANYPFRGSGGYTAAQLLFGKGDLSGDFGGYLRRQLAENQSYLAHASEASRGQIEQKITLIKEVLGEN